jgi:hypothetical protein
MVSHPTVSGTERVLATQTGAVPTRCLREHALRLGLACNPMKKCHADFTNLKGDCTKRDQFRWRLYAIFHDTPNFDSYLAQCGAGSEVFLGNRATMSPICDRQPVNPQVGGH